MPGDDDPKTGRKRWIPLGIFVLLQLLAIAALLVSARGGTRGDHQVRAVRAARSDRSIRR